MQRNTIKKYSHLKLLVSFSNPRAPYASSLCKSVAWLSESNFLYLYRNISDSDAFLNSCPFFFSVPFFFLSFSDFHSCCPSSSCLPLSNGISMFFGAFMTIINTMQIILHSLIFLSTYLFICLCVCVCVCCACRHPPNNKYHGTQVEVRRQPSGISSLLHSCGSWALTQDISLGAKLLS
jgi:hypothetical protein